jgi:hypothetical protein
MPLSLPSKLTTLLNKYRNKPSCTVRYTYLILVRLASASDRCPCQKSIRLGRMPVTREFTPNKVMMSPDVTPSLSLYELQETRLLRVLASLVSSCIAEYPIDMKTAVTLKMHHKLIRSPCIQCRGSAISANAWALSADAQLGGK